MDAGRSAWRPVSSRQQAAGTGIPSGLEVASSVDVGNSLRAGPLLLPSARPATRPPAAALDHTTSDLAHRKSHPVRANSQQMAHRMLLS